MCVSYDVFKRVGEELPRLTWLPLRSTNLFQDAPPPPPPPPPLTSSLWYSIMYVSAYS